MSGAASPKRRHDDGVTYDQQAADHSLTFSSTASSTVHTEEKARKKKRGGDDVKKKCGTDGEEEEEKAMSPNCYRAHASKAASSATNLDALCAIARAGCASYPQNAPHAGAAALADKEETIREAAEEKAAAPPHQSAPPSSSVDWGAVLSASREVARMEQMMLHSTPNNFCFMVCNLMQN